MVVSRWAASSTSLRASAAEPGAAVAVDGARIAVTAASSAPASATAARERGRLVVRWDCTVGLRLSAPGPGKGHVPSASERTVGNRYRQVMEGALVRSRGSYQWSQG